MNLTILGIQEGIIYICIYIYICMHALDEALLQVLYDQYSTSESSALSCIEHLSYNLWQKTCVLKTIRNLLSSLEPAYMYLLIVLCHFVHAATVIHQYSSSISTVYDQTFWLLLFTDIVRTLINATIRLVWVEWSSSQQWGLLAYAGLVDWFWACRLLLILLAKCQKKCSKTTSIKNTR